MAYPADFSDAHLRHWEDAELLLCKNRLANADQLYGFSAECGLKAVMMALGMLADSMGVPLDREFKTHVHELWSPFATFANNRGGARYVGMLPSSSPFQDWSHHDRYAHRRHFRQAQVNPHRHAADGVRLMVEQAKMDGLF